MRGARLGVAALSPPARFVINKKKSFVLMKFILPLIQAKY
jgi:hypothetical protein